MLKTSGEAGGYAQIFIFVQKLCNLDHYPYDFENFLTLSKTSDCTRSKAQPKCVKKLKRETDVFFCNYIFIEKQAICIYLSIHTALDIFRQSFR